MSVVEEDALRNAVDAFLVGVAILDESGEYQYVNDAHAEVYGYDDPNAFLGKTWELCYTDAQADEFDDVFEALGRDGEWRGELQGVRADGSTFPQALSLSTLSDGGLVCVVRDLTGQREREVQLEALNEATRELMAADDRDAVAETVLDIGRGVLEETAVVVWFEDPDAERLEPVATTDDAEAVSGADDARVRPIEAGTREWTAFVDEDPWFVEDYAAVSDADRANPDTELGSVALLPLGDHGLLSAGRRTVDPFGQTERDVLRVLALNATAALDRAARRAELEAKNERLERFTSVVSHDLKNPLTLIRGNAELIEETGDVSHVEEVLAATDRMERLVDDLLTLAREGEAVGERRRVSFESIANRAWNTMRTEHADLQVDATGHVRADPDRLQELLENLFRNALEHGTEGAAEVSVRLDAGEDHFAVADDGPGIPADERDSVFEHGYSTSADGTGFGLAIVDRVAEAHGWTVDVDDADIGGARFAFHGVDVEQ